MQHEDYQHVATPPPEPAATRSAELAMMADRVRQRGAEAAARRGAQAATRAAEISRATALEEEHDARRKVGFMGRIVVQATLPHRDPHAPVYERMNAHQMTLRLTALTRAGLPYGSLARLLLIWMTTEAVRTRDPVLHLGRSFREFLGRLELGAQGGDRGDMTRLRNQLNRLLGSAITVTYMTDTQDVFESVMVARRAVLWWSPRNDQPTLWESTVHLTAEFFEEVTGHAVPLDMAVVGQLRRSPMALDIYAWLTWRFSFLAENRTIPWEYLRDQFGATYGRDRDFRAKFTAALRAVRQGYPEARVEPTPSGLKLLPSPSSVPPIQRRA
jgi:hypothetical protein